MKRFKRSEGMFLKLKTIISILISIFLVTGCNSKEIPKQQSANNGSLPKDIPGFVKERHFENIDWNRKVTDFESKTGMDMIGNKDKVGFVGPRLEVNQVEKWLWHFWGVQEGKLTVIGVNKATSNITPVFSDGVWTKDGIGGGKINGADASLPSNVVLKGDGTWALLVYINDQLFDTLVMDVKKETKNEAVQIKDKHFSNIMVVQKIENNTTSEEKIRTLKDQSKIEKILSIIDGMKVEESSNEVMLEKMKMQDSYLFLFGNGDHLESGKPIPYSFSVLDDGTFFFVNDNVNSLQRPHISIEKHVELLNDMKRFLKIEY